LNDSPVEENPAQGKALSSIFLLTDRDTASNFTLAGSAFFSSSARARATQKTSPAVIITSDRNMRLLHLE
jgi:hypothetical protein